MKNRIKNYKDLLNKVKEEIREDLVDYFNEVNYTKSSTDIEITDLNSEEDLKKIYSGTGFYIILTNFKFAENTSTFSFNGRNAIYRGHCYSVKKRLMSHLANKTYRLENNLYSVCLKINPGENGINISQKPYNKWKWTVIVLKMKGSSKEMREQAELAFDNIYGKPCKSRVTVPPTTSCRKERIC